MPDIATIGAALTSVKTAVEIAKFLKDSDLSIERAETKLKLAELMTVLADARLELADVQTALAEKDARIEELEQAFEEKGDLIRHNDAYYNMNAAGRPTGATYCVRCWEIDHKKRRLVQTPSDFITKQCTACGQKYKKNYAKDL